MLPEIGSGVARENQRRSPSWASPTTVGGATRPIPSPSGRITAKKRMVATLKAIKVELRRRMHARPSEVGAWLRKVVNGYYQYHAVPGNIRQLNTFRQRINRLWYQVLGRRSQRARKRWEALTPLFERWTPRPKVLHPYPQARFYATHPSEGRMRKRARTDLRRGRSAMVVPTATT